MTKCLIVVCKTAFCSMLVPISLFDAENSFFLDFNIISGDASVNLDPPSSFQFRFQQGHWAGLKQPRLDILGNLGWPLHVDPHQTGPHILKSGILSCNRGSFQLRSMVPCLLVPPIGTILAAWVWSKAQIWSLKWTSKGNPKRDNTWTNSHHICPGIQTI